ncbi:hypothetical protein KI387_034126, partial [Taxus chinensis]
YRPNIDVVRKWCGRKWCCWVDIIALPDHALLFNFSKEAEMIKVLDAAPWMFGRTALHLKRWKPGVSLQIKELPIWISLPALPVEFWEDEVLIGIAASMGELISLEPATKARSRLVRARLCVSMEVGAVLPKNIILSSPTGRLVQNIIPEDHGLVCPKCWKVNFQVKLCKFSVETVDEIGRKNSREEVWIFEGEIPDTLRTGNCNNGGTNQSEMALLAASHGDLSKRVGQAATAWKTREIPFKTVHESNKVDSESSEWETGSETDLITADLETATREVNRHSKSMKAHKQRPLNADLNHCRRKMDSKSEKISLARVSNSVLN